MVYVCVCVCRRCVLCSCGSCDGLSGASEHTAGFVHLRRKISAQQPLAHHGKGTLIINKSNNHCFSLAIIISIDASVTSMETFHGSL